MQICDYLVPEKKIFDQRDPKAETKVGGWPVLEGDKWEEKDW